MAAVADYDVICDIKNELSFARSKFPTNEEIFKALVEEVGELAQALLKRKLEGWSDNAVYVEAVQVAAMAIRLATEGEQGHPYDPLTGYRTSASYRRKAK